MLDLTEHTYVHTIWFLSVPKHGFDVFGAVWREGDDPWQARYRFRYDPDDAKSEYSVEFGDKPVEAMIEVYSVIMRAFERNTGGHLDVLPIHGGREETLAILAKQPWCHIDTNPDGKAARA